MQEHTPPRLLLGSVAALEDALQHQIEDIRTDHPLAAVTIIIENTMLRSYLRQRLAFSESGHINLKIVTVSRFAEGFALEHLIRQGRNRIPAFGDRILSKTIAESSAGQYFRPVAYSSGFAESLQRVFREFHQAGITPDHLRNATSRIHGRASEKLADLEVMFRRYESARRNFYTPDDIVASVDQIELDQLNESTTTPVFIYGVWSPTGIQRRMFERMIAAGLELRFFLPETESDADQAHVEIRNWIDQYGIEPERVDPTDSEASSLTHLQRNLFRDSGEPGPVDETVRLLSAPDAPREVREAARTCLKWAEEGIPFHKIAVVYRHQEPYRTLIDQIFTRAGIVTYLHSGRPLISEPSGQRVNSLLHLIGSEMPRSALMEFVTETVLPEETANRYGDDETPVQPAIWDGLSREAGIVQGKDQWLHRLDLLIASKREFIDPDEEVDEDDPHEAGIREIERLRSFVLDLAEKLEPVHDEANWSDHLTYFRELVSTYISGIEPLLDQMGELEQLNQITERVSFERFRETVRHWLHRQDSSALGREPGSLRSGRQFGREGVNVFDIGSLRHVRADAVLVLGVAERQFPPPPRQDPLLLDRERAQLNALGNWHLQMRSQRSEEEALTFAMAIHAARNRVQISYSRSEAGSTRSYLPSHFFRAVASTVTGQNVEAGEIDTLTPDLFTRVPAGSFQPPDGTIALDDHEYDRILLEQDPGLGLRVTGQHRPGILRGRRADQSRRTSRELTEFDGNVERDLARSITGAAGLGNRAISPSRLETFATCPFRFFLKYVLRLEKVEEPEALERIDALNRGSLIHEILELFLQDLREKGQRPDPAYRDAHLARLREIANSACERMASTGLVGYPVMWEFDQITIIEDLEEWYDREAVDLASTDLHPETFELRFGWARRKGEGGKGSRDKPYRLLFTGGELSFQGRVDRVDLMPDRSAFRITDYKTGRSGNYRPETFDGGRSLQLPIYLLATSDLLGIPWTSSEAQYFFPTRRGDYRRIGMSGRWLAENQDDLVTLLRGISQSIGSGLFPQVPKIGSRENCRYCDYKELCPVGVNRIADRKKSDDNVIWLRTLIEAGPG
jgi:ATP-dependent helicase/nuclease subunit B